MSDVQARYAESLMNTFGPPKLVLTRGEGALRLGRRRQRATSTCSAASR